MGKVRKIYESMPDTARASLWFIFANVVQKGISFFTIPLFMRLLTTEQYGEFALYQTWFGVIYIVATLNLSAGVFNKGLIKFSESKDQFTSSMQFLSTIAVVVSVIIYALFSDFFKVMFKLPGIVVYIMFLELMLTPAYNFWMLRERFEYKYKALVALSIIIAIISPLLGIMCVSLSSEKGIARIVALSLVNSVVALFFYIKNFVKGKCGYNKMYWKYALKFNLPLIPHALSSVILSQSDYIMIEKYINKSAVAIYSAGNTISMVINIVVSSVNAVFIPWVYQMCERRDYKKIHKVSNSLLLLMGGMTLFPMLLAPEVIALIAPKEYSQAVWTIPAISLSIFFVFVYTLFCNIEFAYDQTKFVMIASTMAAVTNILLNFVLIPKYGFVAAAYTTLFCYIMLSVLHYIMYKVVCKKQGIKESIYPNDLIVALSLILLGVSVVSTLLYDSSAFRYLIIVCLLTFLIVKKNRILGIITEIRRGEA